MSEIKKVKTFKIERYNSDFSKRLCFHTGYLIEEKQYDNKKQLIIGIKSKNSYRLLHFNDNVFVDNINNTVLLIESESKEKNLPKGFLLAGNIDLCLKRNGGLFDAHLFFGLKGDTLSINSSDLYGETLWEQDKEKAKEYYVQNSKTLVNNHTELISHLVVSNILISNPKKYTNPLSSDDTTKLYFLLSNLKVLGQCINPEILNKIKNIQNQKKYAVKSQDFELASTLRQSELELFKKLL